MAECRFHGERAALWDCPDCRTPYCGECIPGGEDNFGRGEPRCPLCTTSLDYLGGGVEAEPFWRRGPELLRYGLQPGPLTGALIAGLITVLPPGLIRFVLTVTIYLALLSYGLRVTRIMASGSWQPPSLERAFRDDWTLAWKQIGLVLLIFAVPIGAGAAISPVLGGMLFFVAMLVIPAAIMILALSESLLDAANPVLQARLVTTVGWPYLLLWLALSAVLAAPDLVALAFRDSTVAGAALFVIEVLAFYSTVVAYALMGYLLFQYGGELGIATHQQRGRSLSSELYQRKAALGLSHVYTRQGRMDDALDAVNRALSSQPDNAELHERKHRLLKAVRKPEKLLKHGRQYCRLLVDAGNPGNATSVLKDLWQQDPHFRLDDPGAALAIARVFFQQQQFRDAKRLLVNLHRDYPQFEQLGEAYVLLARIYLEGFDSRDHVRRILGFLKKQCPEALDTEDARLLRTMMSQSG